MAITNIFLDKVNRQVNSILFCVPCILMCNFIIPNYNKEFLLITSTIFLLSSLLSSLVLKLFLILIDIDYYDDNDNINMKLNICSSLEMIYLIYIIGCIATISFGIINLYHPAFMLVYLVLCGFLCDITRKLFLP